MENQKFEKLVDILRKNSKDQELKQLFAAWDIAKKAHSTTKRITGESYLLHVAQVATILANWKLDITTVIAGLLHDVDDTDKASLQEISAKFGHDVARIVKAASDISTIHFRGAQVTNSTENLRKLIISMARDIRVVLVVLAEALETLQTMGNAPQAHQKQIASDVLEVFSPLAERMGMGEIKGQMEDLAFSYAYPEEFLKVQKMSKPYYKETENHIKNMKKDLMKHLAAEKIIADIKGRKKHLYSMWKKLQRKEINWDFEKVNDIVALRILVDTTEQCYVALGLVHKYYKPVAYLGVSDFIAQPKPNGYKSIHTKVFGPKGKIVEVQIRTQEMHESAEYGVAAHWAYSQAKSTGVSDELLEKKGIRVDQDRLHWIKQLAQWQKELSKSEDFLNAVKLDVFSHRNFVFTPKGDVLDLPENASVIDFAYAVHTKMGNYIQLAKVNGKVVHLDHKLKSGDVVEIVKSKNPRSINRDWLTFAVTSTARREIAKKLRKLV